MIPTIDFILVDVFHSSSEGWRILLIAAETCLLSIDAVRSIGLDWYKFKHLLTLSRTIAFPAMMCFPFLTAFLQFKIYFYYRLGQHQQVEFFRIEQQIRYTENIWLSRISLSSSIDIDVPTPTYKTI